MRFIAFIVFCFLVLSTNTAYSKITRTDCQTFDECLPRAKNGEKNAQTHLGSLYYHGIGAPKDYKQSIFWYNKAIEQADPKAQFLLARMYFKGIGVSQDNNKGKDLCKQSAQQGFKEAQYHMGVMYYRGVGVMRNIIKSYMWVKLSVKTQAGTNAVLSVHSDGSMSINPFAPVARGKSSKVLDLIAEKMTTAQIAEAKTRAREWKPVCVGYV